MLELITDPQILIKTFGLLGVAIIVFAESGILIGIIFPGDTLLFTAGILAGGGYISLPVLLIIVPIAAIIGDSFGYATGRKFGPKIFNKEESIFFKKSYVTRAQLFFDKYGDRAVIFARFVPVVRTLVPMIAGISGMKYSTFLHANIIGGIAWSEIMLLVGYFLGRRYPGILDYLTYIILVMIIISFIPVIMTLVKEYIHHKKR